MDTVDAGAAASEPADTDAIVLAVTVECVVVAVVVEDLVVISVVVMEDGIIEVAEVEVTVG